MGVKGQEAYKTDIDDNINPGARLSMSFVFEEIPHELRAESASPSVEGPVRETMVYEPSRLRRRVIFDSSVG